MPRKTKAPGMLISFLPQVAVRDGLDLRVQQGGD